MLAAQNCGLDPNGLHNGLADAFRHAYWNALMSREIGIGQAKTVASNHEKYNKGPKVEEKMDLYNNNAGRNAYLYLKRHNKSASDQNIKKYILSLIAKGKLKYLKKGKLVPTNK